MIPRLSAPSVCVIDEDPKDYQPILDALLKLGIACVHVHGDSESPLPPTPFKGLRIVFTDLNLSGASGKNIAAHTANVFLKVVSAETAPVLVVIWSKHTNDPASDLPPDDQLTLADQFQRELLQAEPRFRDRLIFTVMAKPTGGDVAERIAATKSEIEKKLCEFPGCEMLWSWEALIKEAGMCVGEDLTSLALRSTAIAGEDGNRRLDDSLKNAFRWLAKGQGGPDCSSTTAHRHLAAVLGQSLADELEHSECLEELAHHNGWLSEPAVLRENSTFGPQLNGLLLTAAFQAGSRPFMPGVIYRVCDAEGFKGCFGDRPKELLDACYAKLEVNSVWTKDEWRQKTIPVLLEISPVCDFHQGTRRQALLVCGVIGPVAGRPHARSGEGNHLLPPTFSLRWGSDGFDAQDVFIAFCGRYKVTLNPSKEPDWLKPWFRLRELPTASVRNWHSNHSSRVGYVSLR